MTRVEQDHRPAITLAAVRQKTSGKTPVQRARALTPGVEDRDRDALSTDRGIRRRMTRELGQLTYAQMLERGLADD